jgi:hypothetical protein
MPSGTLKLVSICAYLTDTSVPWRPDDWTAMKMVKALKGEPINGYFDYKVGGRVRRFDQANIGEFLDRVPRAMAKLIKRHVDRPATLVPIPNSPVTTVNAPEFRTLQLARNIAAASGGSLRAIPALVFREPQVPSHQGGPRSPYHFETVYQMVREVRGPVVLIDDVCTTGGHLIGAAWKLDAEKRRPIVLACAFGRTTKDQLREPIGLREEELSLGGAFDGEF